MHPKAVIAALAGEVLVPHVPGLVVGRLLGRGGMGAVFLAFEVPTGRRVALKLIAGRSPGADARARFAAEVDALARIRDPHVVALRAAGESDGLPYAVLEHVGGFGLDQIVCPLPWRVATHLGWQLASALAAVHRAGYVHRDVKPANVIVSRAGWATLIDLGLAKRIDRVDVPTAAPQGSDDPQLTAPGTCVGTPRFLAPEVAAGGPATVRSDLFALGLILAHLLGAAAGRGPDDLPDPLADLVARCLAERAEERPGSAAEVAAILADLPREPARLRRNTDGDLAVTWPVEACDRPTMAA